MDKLLGKLTHEATKLKREAKKIAEVETVLERNMREAMSDKHYGCANSILNEIAVACNNYGDRQKVMLRAWEKLQSTPDRWCRILKTLVLIEFLLKNGPEQIQGELQSEQNHIRRMMHLSYMEEGKDRGAAVREKAKAIMDMVQDRNLLREEREKAKQHRTKMQGGSSATDGFSGGSGGGGQASRNVNTGEAQSISRRSFDSRFSELKRKKDQERATKDGVIVKDDFDDRIPKGREDGRQNDSDDDRNRRNGRQDSPKGSASPKDRRRRDSPSSDKGRRRDNSSDSDRGERSRRDRDNKSSEKPGGAGYDLFDAGSAGNADKNQGASAAPIDLLDMADGPSASAASDDWGDFGSAAPSGPSQPMVASAAQPDLFGDASFQAAAGAPRQPTLPQGGDDDDFFGDSDFQSAPAAAPAPVFGGAALDGGFQSAGPGMMPAGAGYQSANQFAAGPGFNGGFSGQQMPMQQTSSQQQMPASMMGGYPGAQGGMGMNAMPGGMAQSSSMPSAPRPKEPEKANLSPEELADQLCAFNLSSASPAAPVLARPGASVQSAQGQKGGDFSDLGIDMFGKA